MHIINFSYQSNQFPFVNFFTILKGEMIERSVKMQEVQVETLQTLLNSFANKDVYIHLETTNGSYAAHYDEQFFNAGAFIRNATINYELAKVVDHAPHRVGLKLPHGRVYAQGITHFELDDLGRLLMGGLDYSGKLAIALEISETPFTY